MIYLLENEKRSYLDVKFVNSTRTILILVFLLLASLHGSSMEFSKNNSSAATPGGVLRMTLVGLPYSLDVASVGTDCQSCWQIINLEYAFGLPTEINGSFNFKAGLFDWFRSNANATVWDFNIRTNASWSDGVPITSSDVGYTFQLGGNFILGTPRDFINLSSYITNVEEINSSDTRFTLDRTLADFGNFLTNQYYYPILPEHFWKNLNSSSLNFDQDVTSGPFYHLNYDGGSNMVLVANPHYWNSVGISQIDVTFVQILESKCIVTFVKLYRPRAGATPRSVAAHAGRALFLESGVRSPHPVPRIQHHRSSIRQPRLQAGRCNSDRHYERFQDRLPRASHPRRECRRGDSSKCFLLAQSEHCSVQL